MKLLAPRCEFADNQRMLETYWQYLPIAGRAGIYFYEQYKSLVAGYLRAHAEELRLRVEDFPELTGGLETRRNS